jgi:hypothetical protein
MEKLAAISTAMTATTTTPLTTNLTVDDRFSQTLHEMCYMLDLPVVHASC